MQDSSVAIVGRPNVGKSTLFNTLVGSRIAIEADAPGVTRDRILYPLTIENKTFDLIDTGGIGIVDRQNLEVKVEKQIDLAIESAGLILFLVDSRDGITPLDTEIANRLRRANKKVLLVATKVDTVKLEENLPSFHALGFGDVIPISAKQNRGISDLEENIVENLPENCKENNDEEFKDIPKIALVGRRNVGKSTLVNQILGTERVIVSDIPGTTRDSLDILVKNDKDPFILIDTAGLRKRGKMDDSLEFFGHMRSEKAIRRADAVVLVLDATDTVGRVDKRIAAFVLENHKPCVIALNKWDLVLEEKPNILVDDYQEYINDNLPGMFFSPLTALSAKNGLNAYETILESLKLVAQAKTKFNTGLVNSAINDAQKKRATRAKGGKLGRIYYATQVEVSPPTFLLFVNNPEQFDDNYKRYLCNQLRDSLECPNIPIKLIMRMSEEKQLGRYS